MDYDRLGIVTTISITFFLSCLTISSVIDSMSTKQALIEDGTYIESIKARTDLKNAGCSSSDSN